MKYKRGDIVIIRFPFSDLSGTKRRPALIISNHTVNRTGDYLMMQITSKLRNDNLTFTFYQNDFVNYKELPLQSCVRLHKVFLLNKNLIISKYTAINPQPFSSIIEKFIRLIK
jgi:mRNA interferase MazF